MNPNEPKPQTPLTPLTDACIKSLDAEFEASPDMTQWQYATKVKDIARSHELRLQEAEARVVELESAESQPDLNEPPQPGFTHKVAAESRLNYIRILLVKLQEAERQRDEAIKQIQVTGAWQCDKCGFQLVKSIFHTRDGSISANKEPFAEQCPNDGTFMRPCTWKEYSESNYQSAVKAMTERDQLIKVCDELASDVTGLKALIIEIPELDTTYLKGEEIELLKKSSLDLQEHSLLPHVQAKKGTRDK